MSFKNTPRLDPVLLTLIFCVSLVFLPASANAQTPGPTQGQKHTVQGKFTSTHKDKPGGGTFTLEFNTAGGPVTGSMEYTGKIVSSSGTATVSGSVKITGTLVGAKLNGQINGNERITSGSSTTNSSVSNVAMAGTFDWANGKASGNFQNDPEFPWEFSFTPINLGIKLTIKDGYERVAADGVSKLVIVAEPPVQVAAQAVDFKIVAPKGAAGEVSGKKVEGGKATATYTAPKAMIEPFTVEIEASAVGNDKQTYTAKIKFEVVYPPVMLVHGVWSNAGAWDFTKSLLKSWGFRYVYTFNYASCNNCNPDEIATRLGRTLNDPNSGPQDLVKKDKTLFTRYNLVGHSLGGLAIRRYLTTEDNYKRVFRVVTLGTPHLGSRFADWFAYFERSKSQASKVANALEEVRAHPNWQAGNTKWENEEFDWLKDKVRTDQKLDATFFRDGEAVDALGWNSDFIKRLNAANQHDDTIDYYFFYGDAPLVSEADAASFKSKLQWASWNDNEVMFDTFFDHVSMPRTDGVVSVESATGQGLKITPNATRRFAAHHIGIVDEASVEVGSALRGYLDNTKGWAYTYGKLASPANLHAYDNQNRHVGLNAQGKVEIGIPGATYSGPEKESGVPDTIMIPGDIPVRFEVKGYQQGTFGLTVRKASDSVDQQVVFKNVPIAAGQTAVLRPSGAAYSALEAPSGKVQPATTIDHAALAKAAGAQPASKSGAAATPPTKAGDGDDLGWLWLIGGAVLGGGIAFAAVRSRKRPARVPYYPPIPPIPPAQGWQQPVAPPPRYPGAPPASRARPGTATGLFCGNCGSPLAPGTQFCGNCGKPV